MGRDISQETYNRIQSLRRRDRLCGGGFCYRKATVRQTHQVWSYKIDEGPSHILDMTMCRKHAHPIGFRGVNFIVTASVEY